MKIFKTKSKKDLYINVFITKDIDTPEYIDIQRTGIIKIDERQNINPYYIDYMFFKESANTINDVYVKASQKNITINK